MDYRVFHNEYIMSRILRMLSLKDQFNCQKCSYHLHDLVVNCVWKQDRKVVDRVQAFALTDDEFFEFLHLIADNVQKLNIFLRQENDLQKYFPKFYDNLLELSIVNSTDDEFTFTSKWFKTLFLLTNLRVLVLKNIQIAFSYKDVWMLTENVPLKRLELQGCDKVFQEEDLNVLKYPLLSGLEVVNTCSSRTFNNHFWLIESCSHLKQLDLQINGRVEGNFFTRFKHLEKLSLNFGSPQNLLDIISHSNLKELNISDVENVTNSFDLLANDEICIQLESLDVSTKRSGRFWMSFFESPATSFNNLQHLKFFWNSVAAESLRWISLKCAGLKTLMFHCPTTGKYINNMVYLQDLHLHSAYLTWSNLYNILHDLKLLERLVIDGDLVRDELPEDAPMGNLGNSLISLSMPLIKINAQLFWEYLSANCENSFLKLCSISLYDINFSTLNCRIFFATFPFLQKLEFSYNENITLHGHMIPQVKHLILRTDTEINWNIIVNILEDSNIELLAISLCVLPFSHTIIPEIALNALKQLHYISLPYAYIESTYLFWRQHLKECQNVQLLCACDDRDAVIKFLLLLLGDEQKQRVKLVYITFDMELVDLFNQYCSEELYRFKVSVRFLDATNEMFKNPYCDYAAIIVV